MKYLIVLLTVLSLKTLSQSLSYSELKWDSFDPNKNYDTYTTKDGTVYKVGGEIKIGQPKSGDKFTFIHMGDGLLLAYQPLPSSFSGSTVEIKKILIMGKKKIGYSVHFRTKGQATVYTIDIENAIEAKEVITGTMSSDEALELLKKEKDKLDLGLITKEEYEARKEELSQYIK